MMYITKETALAMESCIKQTHIEVTKQYTDGQILEINGGAACFSGSESYLSQVVGWGFYTKIKQFKSEILTIEHFYKSLNHPRVDIELCPYTGNDLAVFLSQRGYSLSELNNISALDLTSYKPVDCSTANFIIREMKQNELNDWANRVAAGFGYPEAEEQFTYYAKAKGTTAFGVYDQDKLIAGATIAVHGDVCDLGVTSTILAYRGKGLQKNLLIARLNYAQKQGLSLATVTTEPGSISDLNIQKVGFCCAYTRIKMTFERPFKVNI